MLITVKADTAQCLRASRSHAKLPVGLRGIGLSGYNPLNPLPMISLLLVIIINADGSVLFMKFLSATA